MTRAYFEWRWNWIIDHGDPVALQWSLNRAIVSGSLPLTTDGFHTTCTTCGARLMVQDESAIGEILGCPKCGSMVLVAHPNAESSSVEGTTDFEAATDYENADAFEAAGTASTSSSWIAASVICSAVLGIAGTLVWQQGLLTPNQTPPTHQVTSSPIEEAAPNEADSELEQQPAEVVAQPETKRIVAAKPVIDDEVLVEPVDNIFEHGSAAVDALSSTDSLAPSRVATEDAATAITDQTPNFDTLSNVATLLGGDPMPPEPVLEQIEDASEAAEFASPTLGNKSTSPVLSSRQSPLSVAKRLATRIRAVRFEQVRLDRFLESIMQISGIPVQLEPDALTRTGISVSSTISVQAIDQPVFSILERALEPLKLAPVLDENMICVRNQHKDSDLVRTSIYVGDLLGRNTRELDLPVLVSTLIAPDSWQPFGGAGVIEQKAGKLNITNHRLETIRSAILIEKIRQARGIKTRQNLPSHLASLEPRWVQLNRFLRRPINMDIWREDTFSNAIGHYSEVSGLNVLVDWKSLAIAKVTPDTPVTIYARNELAEHVLLQLLNPNDLAVFPINGNMIQITSVEEAATRQYTELYSRTQLGLEGKSKIEELMLTGSATFESESEFTIVTATASTHQSLLQ